MEKNIYIPIVVVLLSIFAIQSIATMKQKSATYDEPFYLWTGYVYLKTGKIIGELQSPLLTRTLSAIALSFLNLSLPIDEQTPEGGMEYDKRFLYQNNKKPETIIFWGRFPILILGIILGFFVFLWAKLLYGVPSGIFALVIYTFSPNILAHTTVATTDLGVTCFVFISLFCFWKFLNTDEQKFLIPSGITLGLGIISKFSAILLIPIYVVFLTYYLWKKNIPNKVIKILRCFLIILVSAFVMILIAYRISLIDYFFKGFAATMMDIESGRRMWFLGKYSATGFWYFYPLSFLMRTSIPILLFSILALSHAIIKKKVCISEILLLAPIVLFFAAAMLSNKQLGLRYILPVYPLLFVFIGNIMVKFSRKWVFSGTIILLAWYIYSTVRVYPHYHAYANEFIKPQNLYKYCLDVDSGETLWLLSEFVKVEKPAKVYLAYFGTELPEFYFDYQDLHASNNKIINQLDNKEFLAISVLWLQDIFSDNSPSSWVWLKDYKIRKNLGQSIFVYDITNDINAHCNIAKHYSGINLFKDAFVEYNNILEKIPNYQEAKKGLSNVYQKAGVGYANQKKYEKAIGEFKKAIEIYPGDDMIYVGLGLVFYRKGDYFNAEISYKKAIEIDYRNAIAHNCLGVIYYEKKMYEKSLAEYETALKYLPNNVNIRKNLQALYSEMKK